MRLMAFVYGKDRGFFRHLWLLLYLLPRLTRPVRTPWLSRLALVDAPADRPLDLLGESIGPADDVGSTPAQTMNKSVTFLFEGKHSLTPTSVPGPLPSIAYTAAACADPSAP